MIRLVEWLSAGRKRTAALAVGYLIVVTVSHDLMQQPAYWAQGQLSHRSWNNLVAGVCIPFVLAFAVWMALSIRNHPRRFTAALYVLGTILLAVASFKTLLVMNIEVVHFPQYAILTIMVFAIVPRYGETMIWVTLAGLVDEAYQYFVLYRDRGIHFDFNDVVLNQIGAAFGLVLLYAGVGPRAPRLDCGSYSVRTFLRSSAVRAVGALGAMALALYGLGFLRLLRDEGAPALAIILRRGGPATVFWTPTTWGKTYHELLPYEWVPLTALVIGLYLVLDFRSVRPSRFPLPDEAPRRPS